MGFLDILKNVKQKLNEGKDPVCGMKVNSEKTQYKSTYQGKVYGFCSEHCKSVFDQNPNQ